MLTHLYHHFCLCAAASSHLLQRSPRISALANTNLQHCPGLWQALLSHTILFTFSSSFLGIVAIVHVMPRAVVNASGVWAKTGSGVLCKLLCMYA